MAVVAGAVTAAACATAAVLAALTSSSSGDDARSGATAVAAEHQGLPSPAPPRECAVCLSELPAGAGRSSGGSGSEPGVVRALPACGHAFHADCIGRWLPLRPECPLCRRPVMLADGRQQQAAARAAAASVTPAAPAWARPATIACDLGDGRVVWTRSPSGARQ